LCVSIVITQLFGAAWTCENNELGVYSKRRLCVT
jgi:hypothetical protein